MKKDLVAFFPFYYVIFFKIWFQYFDCFYLVLFF